MKMDMQTGSRKQYGRVGLFNVLNNIPTGKTGADEFHSQTQSTAHVGQRGDAEM